MRYFITFSCYGTHLHGDESGSVDRRHNQVGTRVLDPDTPRAAVERRNMRYSPYRLDGRRRAVVLQTLREVCRYRRWTLLAAHVRKSHVHAIVEAENRHEKMMSDFKAYASRALNQIDGAGPDRRRWERHAAHAGCGRIRMFVTRSGTLSRSRASPWRSSSARFRRRQPARLRSRLGKFRYHS